MILNTLNRVLNFEIKLKKSKLKDIKKKELFSNLAILLNTGINIKDSLDILLNDFSNDKDTIRALESIRESISNGKSLAIAFEKTNAFIEYEIFNIKIGEETGKLAITVINLSDYLNKRIEIRRKVSSALSYPIIVFITAILAVIFMLTFVVPMFEDIFNRFGHELPYLTQLIIDLSDNIIWIVLFVLIITFSFIIINYSLKSSNTYQLYKSKMILSIPVVGNIIRKIHLGRFSSAMELFISANIPIHEAIALIREMNSFYSLKSALNQIEHKLVIGDNFHDAVNSQAFFDKRMVAMIKVGMETNQLEEIFKLSKENYHEEITYNTTILNNVLEPILIIFIGLIVATILIGMYLPIFKLSMSFNI